MTTQILSQAQTKQKIRRLAFQIYEHNFDTPTVFLAGIDGMGMTLAQELATALRQISPLQIELIHVKLDKLRPTQSEVELSVPYETLFNQTIILIDDVLNTGRTLAYSLRPFLKMPIEKLQTAVLVDRGHHSFPISADFAGYRLSTTLHERIEVVLDDEKKYGVYLH